MDKSTPDDSRIAEANHWQGTEPSGGTRRAVIRDAIAEFSVGEGSLADNALGIADAIELALLEATEKDGPPVVDGAETWQFEFPEVNDPMTDDAPRWRWRLNAAGETVAQSESYSTKEQAEEMADAFKAHAAHAGFPLGA